MEVDVYDKDGQVVGKVELSDHVFGVPFNEALVHQVVIGQLANARTGTAATKTRGMVSGGGRKPWRQKGTGRARQGSTRAPHWKGGGVAFGPHPRSYEQATPRKMRRQALRCVLSAKVADHRLRLLQDLQVEEPHTKEIAQLFQNLKVDHSVLIVTPAVDVNVFRSARNIPGAAVAPAEMLNALELIRREYLVMPVAAARKVEQVLGQES